MGLAPQVQEASWWLTEKGWGYKDSVADYPGGTSQESECGRMKHLGICKALGATRGLVQMPTSHAEKPAKKGIGMRRVGKREAG